MAMDITITIVVLTLTLVQFIFTWAVQTMDMVTDMVTDTDITTDMVVGKVRYTTSVDKISMDNFYTVFMRHK